MYMKAFFPTRSFHFTLKGLKIFHWFFHEVVSIPSPQEDFILKALKNFHWFFHEVVSIPSLFYLGKTLERKLFIYNFKS